jgi:hypothetical protein
MQQPGHRSADMEQRTSFDEEWLIQHTPHHSASMEQLLDDNRKKPSIQAARIYDVVSP